jgi:hypothetical protein
LQKKLEQLMTKEIDDKKIILQIFWENGAFGGCSARFRFFERNTISL